MKTKFMVIHFPEQKSLFFFLWRCFSCWMVPASVSPTWLPALEEHLGLIEINIQNKKALGFVKL